MWTRTQFLAFLHQRSVSTGGAFAVGTTLGAVSAYFISKKRLSLKYAEIAEEEIAQAKVYYSILYKDGENGDLEALAAQYKTEEDLEEAVTAMRKYAGINPLTEEERTEAVLEEVETEVAEAKARNIFADSQPPISTDLDARNILDAQDKESSHVITKMEFAEGPDEGNAVYEQITLTYFEEDGVLIDERDEPVPDPNVTVGDVNLEMFGVGSDDNNIVYIRNPTIEVDFEVIRSKGSYAKSILGFDDSEPIQHSDRRRRRQQDE